MAYSTTRQSIDIFVHYINCRYFPIAILVINNKVERNIFSHFRGSFIKYVNGFLLELHAELIIISKREKKEI